MIVLLAVEFLLPLAAHFLAVGADFLVLAAFFSLLFLFALLLFLLLSTFFFTEATGIWNTLIDNIVFLLYCMLVQTKLTETYLNKAGCKVCLQFRHIEKASIVSLFNDRFSGGTGFNAINTINRHALASCIFETLGKTV